MFESGVVYFHSVMFIAPRTVIAVKNGGTVEEEGVDKRGFIYVASRLSEHLRAYVKAGDLESLLRSQRTPQILMQVHSVLNFLLYECTETTKSYSSV